MPVSDQVNETVKIPLLTKLFLLFCCFRLQKLRAVRQLVSGLSQSEITFGILHKNAMAAKIN